MIPQQSIVQMSYEATMQEFKKKKKKDEQDNINT